MTDLPTIESSASGRDLVPLLPRGAVVFEGIPVRAIVMEALAPAIGDGTLVVRDGSRSAVVLIHHAAIFEVHVFSDDAPSRGEGTVAGVQEWGDADVWAHRLDPSLVDLCSALLRGETIYDDLRLRWTNWPALLADLGRRGGAFVVEIFSPAGRGVTCVAGGRQALSYTDIHPSLGDPALLEAMAQNGEGSVRVRRVSPGAFADRGTEARHPISAAPAREDAAGSASRPASVPHPLAVGDHRVDGAAHVEPQSPPPRDWPPTTWQPPQPAVPHATPAAAQPDERALPDDRLPELGWIAPWQTAWREEAVNEGDRPAAPAGPVLELVLGDLRAIARRRLHLSASRVVAVLDEAALQQRSVDTVLAEIREMSIRGVMPSTVEEMVDEMAGIARQRAG